MYRTGDPIANIYQGSLIKSVDISKGNGETRPLGILEWTKKVKFWSRPIEAIRSILPSDSILLVSGQSISLGHIKGYHEYATCYPTDVRSVLAKHHRLYIKYCLATFSV